MAEITSIRYNLISKTVFRCLEIMNYSAYPIDPKLIAKNITTLTNGAVLITIDSYESFAAYIDMPVADIISKYFKSLEGATVYFTKTNHHAIFYNNLISAKGRINWTIAHELGHVLLKHFLYMDPLIINRGPGLNSYRILEAEADLFAKYLLCHPYVLKACGQTLDAVTIKNACHISKDAANNCFKDLNNLKGPSLFNPWDDKILERLYAFAYQRRCKNCGKIFALKNAVYCPICKNEPIHFYNGPESAYQKEFAPYYAANCHHCGQNILNEDAKKRQISTGKCPNCGSQITNHCTKEGLKLSLPPDARYCYHCGAKSSYYHERLLTTWR